MLDLLIRNAQVIDGSGAPAIRRDVGVRAGKIVLEGKPGPAAKTLDADGLTLCPGFVDIHTHYDAQLGWDAYASPSCQHGITSVLSGNCGFTLAPLKADYAEYIMRMMSVVEGMPLVSLQQGLDWNWRSFGEYLARYDGKIAINAGFMTGHSALRLAVMGKAAVGSTASDDQVKAMAALLQQCLREGALGFSTSQSFTHVDADGAPVPSRAASREETLALAAAIRPFAVRNLQITMSGSTKGFTTEERDLMTVMSRLAAAPINWNPFQVKTEQAGFIEHQLAVSDHAAQHGARILGLVLPKEQRLLFSFGSGIPLNALPGWSETFALDKDGRKRAFSDPAVRRSLRACETSMDLGGLAPYAKWAEFEVVAGGANAKPWLGQKLGDIARASGREVFDVLMDLVVADNLQTLFFVPQMLFTDAAWRRRAELVCDPRVAVGGSDAGAHLDLFTNANYATDMLANMVRKRGLLSLERAIARMTDAPCRLYGLKDRGRIADGWAADLVLFDPATVGPGADVELNDLPGGAKRIASTPTGMAHVFVNGVEVSRNGELTGSVGGQVLRPAENARN